MLVDDTELESRLSSPMNLLNRLREMTNIHRSNNKQINIPSLPPSSSDLIPNIDEKIEDVSNKTRANRIMNAAMTQLEARLPEVHKPERLAAIVNDMSKVISNIDQKNPNDGKPMPQIIIYAPTVAREEDFNIIDLKEA